MSNYYPLLVSVALILFIGLVIPYFVGFFVDISDIEVSPLVQPVIDLISTGFELDLIPFTDWGTFNINPFSWLGDTLQNYVIDSLTYLSLFPDFIIIIFLTLILLSILLSIFSLIRG